MVIRVNRATENAERIIAERLLEQLELSTLEETNEICVYNGGYYHRGSKADAKINSTITDLGNSTVLYKETKDGELCSEYKLTTGKRNEIIKQIQTRTYITIREFWPPRTCIFCRNGVHQVDIDRFQKYALFRHEPYKTFYQLPWAYNPDALCPKIEETLKNIVDDKVDLIYEMIAYILMPHVDYQKAFLFLGPPSAGKTTLIELILTFLCGYDWEGVDYIANMALEELGKSFQLAELRDKLLNYFDDLDEQQLESEKYFRIVATNKYLGGQIKKVQTHVKWRNRCKQLYSCNDPPEFKKDPGEKFWRRWILIECFRTFVDADKIDLINGDKDIIIKEKGLFNKLTSESEMSGLLNKVIEAWHRLEDRGCFPKEWDNTGYVQGLWMININGVKLFIDECCELGVDYEVDYNFFFRNLNEFRIGRNAKPITKNIMTRHLELLGIKGFNANKKIDKRYHQNSCGRNYVGLRIKQEHLDVADLEIIDKRESLMEHINEAKKSIHGEDDDFFEEVI